MRRAKEERTVSAKLLTEGPLDINTASLASLRDGVAGIGPVLAGRIVSHREEHGSFGDVSELRAVRGIGPRLLERIRGQLRAGHADPATDQPATPELSAGPDAPKGGTMSGTDPGMVPDAFAAVAAASTPVAGAGGDRAPDQGTGSTPERDTRSPESAGISQEARGPTPPLQNAGPERGSQGAPAMPAGGRVSLRQGAILVLLGGLLGAVLTLTVLLIVSGTLDYAPHREVRAQSRTLSSVQTSQELASQRIERLSARLGDLEEGLAGLRADMGKLVGEFAALRADMGEAMGKLDKRVSTAEEEVKRLDKALGEMQDTLRVVQERVKRFDAFLTALRDLLVQLQGPGPATGGGAPTPGP